MNEELTKNKALPILVVGAGAIGGVCAGFMAHHSLRIDLITKHEDLAQKITNQGIQILSPHGNFQVKIPAYPDLSSLTGTYDLILMVVKATDLEKAVKVVQPFMHENSAIITLENGICEDLVAKMVGQDHVIGCIVGWGATMHSPGVVEMTSPGEFVIGNLDNTIDPRIEQARDILSTINPCYISQNIYGTLYSKLIINSCITSLGAICGQYLGEMLASKLARRIFIEIIRESIAVADAINIRVEVFGGKLDFYSLLKGKSWFADLKRHLLIRIIGFKYRRLKSSSLQSLERGKKTEIDYLNGYIVARGREKQIPTPINTMVVNIIKEIEAGKRTISKINFEDFIPILPKK
ncbi:MAG: 2-dehydropantoate 2-reductase [Promethearchaeia archaeon]|nr:MAG: 2-dehydropantoate 2-reductase [Candidatus Lokiarchaeia archaeon]